MSQTVKATLAALSLLAAENLVNAGCAEAQDCTDYPLFAEKMENNAGDYTWRSHEVVTSDGYELTMFEIIGDDEGDKVSNQGKKGQLLLLHGYASDSQTWFDQPDPNRGALPQQLLDEGYSVWLGNVRGATYSQGHNNYIPYSGSGASITAGPDYERYWNFDMDDIAEKDIPAMLGKMQEFNSECKKMSIVAHSGGTNVVMNALSKASRADNYVAQVVNMEPCFLQSTSDIIPGGLTDLEYYGLNTILDGAGIESAFGPLWEQQLLALQAVEPSIAQALAAIDTAGMREVGIKHTEHFIQNDLIGDWQAFANNWLFFWTRNTPDIRPQDVNSNINVRMMFADADTLCPRDRMARAGLFNFPSYNSSEDQFLSGGHSTASSSNQEEFFNKLKTQLDPNAGENMGRRVCRRSFNFGL